MGFRTARCRRGAWTRRRTPPPHSPAAPWNTDSPTAAYASKGLHDEGVDSDKPSQAAVHSDGKRNQLPAPINHIEEVVLGVRERAALSIAINTCIIIVCKDHMRQLSLVDPVLPSSSSLSSIATTRTTPGHMHTATSTAAHRAHLGPCLLRRQGLCEEVSRGRRHAG